MVNVSTPRAVTPALSSIQLAKRAKRGRPNLNHRVIESGIEHLLGQGNAWFPDGIATTKGLVFAERDHIYCIVTREVAFEVARFSVGEMVLDHLPG